MEQFIDWLSEGLEDKGYGWQENIKLKFPAVLLLPWTSLYMLITKAITWH